MKLRIGILAMHFSLFLTLAFAYENFVAARYGYEGYLFHPDPERWVIALISVAALSLITPVSSGKPSTLFHHLTLAVVLMPMLVMFHAADKPSEFTAMVMLGYALSIVLPRFLTITPPRFSQVSRHGLRRAFLLIALVYIAALFMLGSARYMNFDLSKVYDFRRDAASNLPGIFGYISPLIGKVVVPIAFVISLLHKKYLSALVSVCCAVLIFGMTAHKSTLFSPLLIFLVYVVSRSRNLIYKFNLTFLVVLLIALGDFWLQVNYAPETFGTTAALTLERVFFTPAHLNYMYYDFFSKNEWVLFSNSKLTLGLLDYPYPLDGSYMIGDAYFGNDQMSANTGWFGSGYMQAGFAGVLLYALIIGAVFKYIDECARRSGEQALITASVIVPVVVLVTSSDLPTAFVTHGLYINLMLIACFHNEDLSNAHSPSEQRSFA